MPGSRAEGRRRSPARTEPATPKPPPDAFEAAVHLLAQRAHSEVELRRKLQLRRCPATDIDRALERARALGYLDDAAFAKALTVERARAYGPARIARELGAKGVSRDLVREAVGEVARDEVLATARRLAQRGVASGADRRVVAARLLRRGFPGDVVREAVGREVELDPDVE